LTRSLFAETKGVAWAHAGWGEALLAAGDTAAARLHFRESLQIFGELGDSAIIWSLAGMAGVAVACDEAEPAVRLWGAVEALRERSKRGPAPAARAGYERAVARARAGLGQAAFDAAWTAGRRLSLDQAVALAATIVAATPNALTAATGIENNGASIVNPISGRQPRAYASRRSLPA
jgi:hypothetical protein